MTAASVPFQSVGWSLVSQDDGTEVRGQFMPSGLVENVAGDWAEQSTIGLDQPILQFVSGRLDTISFDAKLWALHQGSANTPKDDLESEPQSISGTARSRFSDIRNLARSDPDLGRPHVWLFTVGTQFSQLVVVRSVGGIRYDRMRPDGSLRGALFSIDMARYLEAGLSQIAAGESLVSGALEGEDYEALAKRVYKEPILGEALRRRNPDRRYLAAGDLVHVPRARTLRSEIQPLRPASLFLKPGNDQDQLRRDSFEVHSGDHLSHILLSDF